MIKSPSTPSVLLFTTFGFAVLCLAACTSSESVLPVAAQTMAQSAWAQSWQGTWELTWQESPISGPIIFAGWQTEQIAQTGAKKQRFEILEATVPSLIGLVYINDGQDAYYFNRLEADSAITKVESPPLFSPLTDAFDQVTKRLAKPPQSVRQQTLALPQGPGLQLKFTLAQKEFLTLWLDTTHNLIIKADLKSPDTHFTLTARTLLPLTQPHPDLFKGMLP